MERKRIKIGHQEQANLPIYLTSTGKILCGDFQYCGVKRKHFAGLFTAILDLVGNESEETDVSRFRYWNALSIYNEHIAPSWKKTLSATTLQKLSIETEVFLMLQPVREVFKRSVSAKWRKEFSKTPASVRDGPFLGWHVLKKPGS